MRLAKAWPMPKAEAGTEESPALIMKAVDRLAPY
jgi:hypothetical protein